MVDILWIAVWLGIDNRPDEGDTPPPPPDRVYVESLGALEWIITAVFFVFVLFSLIQSVAVFGEFLFIEWGHGTALV